MRPCSLPTIDPETMEKILVTTDQSANSKAAIRFAIKLAKQRNAALIVLHIYHLVKPFKWTATDFAQYSAQFREQTIEELSAFIAEIYKGIDEPEINYQLALASHIDIVEGISDYAARHDCAYICISTRGAGTLKKIFGTHTAKLIGTSTVPVLCIPSTYHLKPLKSILYASDMGDYENELKKVVDFAKPLQASLDMMHISDRYEFSFDKELVEANIAKKTVYPVNLLTPKRDITHTLLEDIDRVIKSHKPSLLVLFTHQSRSLFEKFFFPSNAKGYSFYGKIPLLTFNKQDESK